MLVLGGGAAGMAAVVTLRHEGYDGPVTMATAESGAPVDRPNLSKDYLAGTAPEEWMPLRPAEWYAEHDVHLRTGCRATLLDPGDRDCTVRYVEGGRVAAVATIGRDAASLRAEAAMERELRSAVGAGGPTARGPTASGRAAGGGPEPLSTPGAPQ